MKRFFPPLLATVALGCFLGGRVRAGTGPLRDRVTLSADTIRQSLAADTLTASGHVVVKVREVEVHGDRLVVDLKTNMANLSGHVELRAHGQTIRGGQVTLNLKTGRWTSRQAQVTLSPDFFVQGVAKPLFAKGTSFVGSEKELVVRQAAATSCDLKDPHYRLEARQVFIYPDDKLVAKRVRFMVGHTTVASLPSYVISLKPRRRRQQLVPILGYNEVEGAFAKTSYNYLATEAGMGVLYLDLMQKRGVGVGVEHEYRAGPYWGVAYLYGLRDRRTGATEFNARLHHTQHLSDILDAQLRLDFTRNNAYYARAASNLNAELTLRRQTDTAQSTFTLRQQRSTGFGTRTNITSSFQHQQRFSSHLSTNFRANFRKNDLGVGLAADQELNSLLEVLNHDKRLDLLCRVEDRLDLDGSAYQGDNSLYAFERLPEIILRSDTTRLGRGRLFGMFPVRAETSVGKYRELPAQTHLTRTYFRADLQPYRKAVTGSSELRVGGSFRQTLYSNDTAQYVLNYYSELDNELSRDWNLRLGYRKQRPAGFTPFRLDFASRYESADLRLSFNQNDRQQFSLSGGYDFERRRYRDMIFRYQLMPNDTYYLSLSGGYDLENGEFRDFLTRLELRRHERFSLDLNTRYSPRLGQLTRINAYLYCKPHRFWEFEALSGYNGFTNHFDFNQIKVTRDLHCWQAFLTYDQQRREFRLDLALKAFPAFDTRFGVGQSGQGLNTSVGQVF